MTDAITRLAAHMRWADARTLHALRRAGAAPARALEIYSHVLGSEHTWLAHMRGESTRIEVWPVLDLAGCEALARENADELDAFIQGMTDADLDQDVSYVNTRGEPFVSRRSDILLHMSLHGSYHRGQVALLLRLDDIQPLATDYIMHARGS